jgi:inner membrane protein
MRKPLPNLSGLPNGMYAELPDALLEQLRKGGSLDWRMPVELLGQKQLEIAPVADVTQVHLRSPWPHPSFGGHFLPGKRVVTSAGFEADWKVSSFSSSARSQFEERRGERGVSPKSVLPDAFNVKLIEPLDVYALSTRATKYGLLFITLTLAAVFMFEVMARLRLHPVQYSLVGLSIAIFFLLLLALSEKFAFGIAYAVAAGASVAVLAIYFTAVLQRVTRGLSLAAGVALLYAALYGLLMSEDNALLLGSLLLFGVLAAFMVGTRRIDWYALGGNRPHAAGGATAAQPAAPGPNG